MRQLSAADALLAAAPALFAPVAGRAALGLAVSGGGDSLALMLLAARWAAAQAEQPRLVVYSVDHGLRPEAAGEAAFVAREGARLGLEVRILRWAGDKPTAGIQAAARAARYRLIGDAMRADGIGLLLTAHQRDDQAETVLMRLAHGSGLEGLRGMDAFATVEGVVLFRPVLDISREALRAVVAEAGLVPVTDPSNDDRHYERVRWRQAMPQLARLGIDGFTVSQLARRAGEADAALAQWADKAFAELAGIDPLGAVELPSAPFLELPRAVAVKLLGRVLALAGGGQRPRALGVVERLQQRLAARDFAGATVLGTAVERRGASLWFSREAGRHAVVPAVLAPMAQLIWDRRFRIANRLAAPIDIHMAGAVSRQAAEQLVGRSLPAPAAAIRAAPLVKGPAGEALALGAYRLGEGVAVELLDGGRGITAT